MFVLTILNTLLLLNSPIPFSTTFISATYLVYIGTKMERGKKYDYYSYQKLDLGRYVNITEHSKYRKLGINKRIFENEHLKVETHFIIRHSWL